MADHRIEITALSNSQTGRSYLAMDCVCGAYLGDTIEESAALDELNRLAHEHIEAAERADVQDVAAAIAAEMRRD